MIRKWLGRLAAAAVVALLVFAVLHRAKYRSLLFDAGDGPRTGAVERAEAPAAERTEEQPAAAPADADGLTGDKAAGAASR